MKNIKMVYQYDGSKFYGFQRQNGLKTVQGEIEKFFFQRFSQKVNIISAGRTDKGVHALGQVSNFAMEENIPLETIKNQMNRQLYKEIRILSVDEVPEGFNARFDAVDRTYLYIMKEAGDITPFEADYVSKIKGRLDVEQFREIMDIFIGKHDFKSFMKRDKAFRNTTREIYNIKCSYDEFTKRTSITVRGSSFLKTMVRIMIGSALAVYFGEKGQDYIKRKMEFPDEYGEKILAPSEGLYLYKVNYGGNKDDTGERFLDGL